MTNISNEKFIELTEKFDKLEELIPEIQENGFSDQIFFYNKTFIDFFEKETGFFRTDFFMKTDEYSSFVETENYSEITSDLMIGFENEIETVKILIYFFHLRYITKNYKAPNLFFTFHQKGNGRFFAVLSGIQEEFIAFYEIGEAEKIINNDKFVKSFKSILKVTNTEYHYEFKSRFCKKGMRQEIISKFMEELEKEL